MRAGPPFEMSQGELACAKPNAAVWSGVFQPGDRLLGEDIETRLSLSRSPVREAPRQLQVGATVEHRPGLRAVRRGLSHAEVAALDENKAGIANAVADPDRAGPIDQQFHRCIYLEARNRFLPKSARALTDALIVLGPATVANEVRIAVMRLQHQPIIDAIRVGGAEAAGALAEAHPRTALRHRLSVMRG